MSRSPKNIIALANEKISPYITKGEKEILIHLNNAMATYVLLHDNKANLIEFNDTIRAAENIIARRIASRVDSNSFKEVVEG